MIASSSLSERIQTYLYTFKYHPTAPTTAEELSTLALLVLPFWRSKSASLWSLARSRARGKNAVAVSKSYERFVLESMSVEEAMERIQKLNRLSTVSSPSSSSGSETEVEGDRKQVNTNRKASPLAALAEDAICSFVRKHAETIFLQSVSGEKIEQLESETACYAIISAGRSLDNRITSLVDLFEKVCCRTIPMSEHLVDTLVLEDQDRLQTDGEGEEIQGRGDDEIRALLHAIALFKRIISSPITPTRPSDTSVGAHSMAPRKNTPSITISLPSSSMMLTPPPSPSRKDAVLKISLRRCLDSTAFFRDDALEDARDRVVDMLTSE